ncbi:MAG TPA: glutathione S-transferase C-terminal domain-containing protein [Lysobacter sp.]
MIGSLRHWTMTGKLVRRAFDVVEGKRAASLRTLGLLDRELAQRRFIAGDTYTIADIAVFAYAARAGEAGLDLTPFAAFREWVGRVERQPGHLAESHPYAIDPHSVGELP